MALDGINTSSIKDVERSITDLNVDPSLNATPAQVSEQELLEVDAAIDEAWEHPEPSMRYLADR